jgi:hypothetical protein
MSARQPSATLALAGRLTLAAQSPGPLTTRHVSVSHCLRYRVV